MAGNLRAVMVGPIPKNIWARPILARIRKSLFDILRERLKKARFLDLFAGSATVGIEALSRGARQVVFVDFNPQLERWIKSTLADLQKKYPSAFEGAQTAVHRADVTRGLAWLGQEFDIIFSGAPYVDKEKKLMLFVTELLKQIEKEKLLAPGGWFIAQHSRREPFEVPPSWQMFRQEKYGDSALSFFKQVDNV